MRALRDDLTVQGTAIWGQFYGATNSRENDRSFFAFGRTSAQAIGYRQDAFGAQAGLDMGRMDADGGFVVGVTGGYLNSDLNFPAASDRTTYTVINAGAYASFRGGPFFVNALGKYDWVDVKLRAPTLGVVAKPDARALAGNSKPGSALAARPFSSSRLSGSAMSKAVSTIWTSLMRSARGSRSIARRAFAAMPVCGWARAEPARPATS